MTFILELHDKKKLCISNLPTTCYTSNPSQPPWTFSINALKTELADSAETRAEATKVYWPCVVILWSVCEIATTRAQQRHHTTQPVDRNICSRFGTWQLGKRHSYELPWQQRRTMAVGALVLRIIYTFIRQHGPRRRLGHACSPSMDSWTKIGI